MPLTPHPTPLTRAKGLLPRTLPLRDPDPLTCAPVEPRPRRHPSSPLSSADQCPSAPRSPGTGETPTLSTLDFYMARLHGAIERDPAQHEKLIVRIKEILAQVARCVPRLFCFSPRSPDGAAEHAALPQAGPALVGLGGNACILPFSGVPGFCGR